MTKKHPSLGDVRGTGGAGGTGGVDGTGGGESPTERLLREALAARADRITVHDLRPAAPPSRRVRRLRPVYVAAVPLFGLAAALAFGVLGLRGDNVARHDQVPPAATLTSTPTPSATPSVSPSATAPVAGVTESLAAPGSSGSTSPTAATPYTFRGVKFQLPAGWRVPVQDPNSTTLCVLSPGAPQTQSGSFEGACGPYGIVLAVYNTPEEVGGATWPTSGALDAPDGWAHQPYCSAWGNPHEIGPSDTYRQVGSPVRTRDIVASRAVYKTQWQVSCNTRENYTVQMWGLKGDQVFVVASGLKPDYQAGLVSILDTLDLTGRQAPLLMPHTRDIEVTTEGLGVGQQVSNDGTAVTFSVTYRNTSQTSYPGVQPLLFAEQYAGSPGQVVVGTEGTLERQDGTTWTQTDTFGTGSGMDYATQGRDAVFPLAPGQSRTVKYRMKLTARDGAGVLPVTAQAVLPYSGSGELSVLGEKSVPVRVVTK
ncbi:hypothetical protein [Kitasatospora sp. NBC_00315]|uniref:hypothetical protein n=1 Tax=Kitasatospora sp. NBC_00315 TaxID=2975963 RepID=UPI003247FB70